MTTENKADEILVPEPDTKDGQEETQNTGTPDSETLDTDMKPTEIPNTEVKNTDDAFEELYTEILEHFRSFSPSEQIAGTITEEHITEYLEGTREERLLAFKERREKRFLTSLEILATLTSIVLIVWLLKDNPAILVNILYIIGGLGVFFLWKRPHDKDHK